MTLSPFCHYITKTLSARRIPCVWMMSFMPKTTRRICKTEQPLTIELERHNLKVQRRTKKLEQRTTVRCVPCTGRNENELDLCKYSYFISRVHTHTQYIDTHTQYIDRARETQ